MTHALITIAKDLPPWYAEIVQPRMIDYAKRIGAEFVEIVPPKWEGMMTRQMTANYVMRYDRALVLDADVVISREAPDIFALHPSGAVWMASDSEPNDPLAVRQEHIRTILQSALGPVGWFDGYGNSGVVLCDREHHVLWRNWPQIPARFCADQCAINYKLRASRWAHAILGREWNSFGLNNPFRPCGADYNTLERVPEICQGAHIAHAAGFAGDERDNAIREMDRRIP